MYPPSAAASAAALAAEAPPAASRVELLYARAFASIQSAEAQRAERFASLLSAVDRAGAAGAPPAASPAVDSGTPPQAAADAADWLLCVVCMTAERNIMFTPCNHFVCCSACANGPNGQNEPISKCPTCRGLVGGTMRVYT